MTLILASLETNKIKNTSQGTYRYFEGHAYLYSLRDAPGTLDVSREPRRRTFHPNVRHLELRSPPLRDDHLRQLPFSRPLKQPGL